MVVHQIWASLHAITLGELPPNRDPPSDDRDHDGHPLTPAVGRTLFDDAIDLSNGISGGPAVAAYVKSSLSVGPSENMGPGHPGRRSSRHSSIRLDYFLTIILYS